MKSPAQRESIFQPGETAPSLSALNWDLDGLEIHYSLPLAQHDESARNDWLKKCSPAIRWTRLRQVHGTAICDADVCENFSEGDGLICRDRSRGLAIYGADCPGIVVRTPDAWGAAHCGWRGTAGGMVGQLISVLRGISENDVDTWSAFIGPGICGPCYLVGPEVIDTRSWPEGAVSRDGDGSLHLDLAAALHGDLETCGLRRIFHSGVCTHCDPRLHSFRYQGLGRTQLLSAHSA